MSTEQELRSLWDTIRCQQAKLWNSAFWPEGREERYKASCQEIIELASDRIMQIHMAG
jgi:hypothetical protein